MDAITRAVLEKWFDEHRDRCGVDCFDVSLQRYESLTRIVLSCPTCRCTIGGISDTETPKIVRSLLRRSQLKLVTSTSPTCESDHLGS
jgi:hypothetical protein